MAETAIDKIRRASVVQRRKITVKEWENLDVWIPKITVGDIQAMRALAPDSGDAQNVHLLIRKAQDEAGQPLFQLGHYDFLMNEADYTVVSQVIAFMFAAAFPSLEAAVADQRKTIETDPTSASATP